MTLFASLVEIRKFVGIDATTSLWIFLELLEYLRLGLISHPQRSTIAIATIQRSLTMKTYPELSKVTAVSKATFPGVKVTYCTKKM
jgi:hypothetical protein